MSEIVSGVGMSPVERIPLLGRDGPDLTINETGLVINVKSRKKTPEWVCAPKEKLLVYGDLVGFRLKHLLEVQRMAQEDAPQWKQLLDWYEHMDDWTKKKKPDCISAIFVHKPRMPIGNMTVVIHKNHLRRLQWTIK